MSTLGLWIVTGLNSALIALVGGFTYFGLSGITRVATKTGEKVAEEMAEEMAEIPVLVKTTIEQSGASMINATKSAANNKSLEMGSQVSTKIPEVAQGEGKALAAEGEGKAPTAEEQVGGGKQTKGNKPKKIRKPRTKKNIKKVGNQMYMNFSL